MRANPVSSVEELRFYMADDSGISGPRSAAELQDLLGAEAVSPDTRLRPEGSDLWAPLSSWAPFAGCVGVFELPRPPEVAATPLDVSGRGQPGDSDLQPSDDDSDDDEAPDTQATGAGGAVPDQSVTALGAAPPWVFDALSFVLQDATGVFGPLSGAQVRRGLEDGRYVDASACVVGWPSLWRPTTWFFKRGTADSVGAFARPAVPALSFAEPEVAKCPICLESVPVADLCAECGEALSGPPSTARPASIPDDQIGDSWLKMHWRPLITLGAIMSLICFGIVLRYLAPGRFYHERANPRPAMVTATCESACWSGETCQLGQCVWAAPNDVGHVSDEPVVAGPFELGSSVSDVLPLDDERFAVALLAGIQIRSTRTGEVQTLINGAPQARRMHRVGDAVYATSPSGIYVVDVATTRLLKTLELGAIVGDVSLGASGTRALVSLPGAHAIAVVETSFHAEVDRIRFVGDPVGPVGADDTGGRALTTTGRVPLAGLRGQTDGAVYAFDPSRLASEQDRVRTSMLGNPVSVLITPDGEKGLVVLREKNQLVQVHWQPSGAVRLGERIETCREPEQLALLRKGRRAIVRCNGGHAIEVFDLAAGKLLAHVPFNTRAADLVVTPDGQQALVALPDRSNGNVAVVELETYDVRMVPVSGPPTRLRLAPDGHSVVALSEQTKEAWVIR